MSDLDDLIAFTVARLDEDEAIAQTATDGPWHPDGMSVRGKDRDYASGKEDAILVIRHTWPQEAAHICRHDPARVLREVEAGRKLIAFALENAAEIDGEWGDGHDATEMASGQCEDYGAEAARKILEPLAAAWSDHPDYREEWKL